MAIQKKQKRKLRLGRLILLILFISVLVLMGAGAGVMASVLRNLPSFDFENVVPLMTTFIYDQDGNVIDELHGGENRIPVRFDVIPDHLKEAFLATEDRDFYNHFGFDIRGIARAAIVNISAGSVRQGASTITQQLARTAILKRDERKIERKLQELVVAIQLERLFTKDEIFEQYLNWVYFGEGAHGVQAAAKIFYGKDVKDLTLAESASLAGMVKAPGGRYSPFRNMENAMARRNLVISLMAEAGYITPEEAKKAQAEPFKLADRSQTQLRLNYPYFTDHISTEAARLLEESGHNPQDLFTAGLKVYTTMDTRIQTKMQEVYSNSTFFPQGPKGSERTLESAMVVIDHRTGEIKGMVGGREYNVQKGLNRATQADRQPGSAIKPIVVYGPAFEKGYSPATVLDDSPVTYETPGSPPWTPKNYDGRWRGLITVREAVKDSVNIPAVRMLEMIGVNEGLQFGRKLGLPLNPQQDRNLSLALGGLTRGVSPLSMASAYGAFANQGVLIQPHAITKITDRHDNILVSVKPKREVVMSEQTAYLITDVLQTVVDSGTGRQAKMDRPVAGKTGTTQLPDHLAAQGLRGTSNAWFVAYTPELVGAVYLGYDRTDATHYLPANVAGGGHPARIWKAVMTEALKDVQATPFIRPKGLVYSSVDAKSGLLPSELTPSKYIIQEVFAKDTIPTQISAAWYEKQICAETGLLPSPYCPNLTMKVFLNRPPWEGEVPPEDSNLTAPTEICTVHRPWYRPAFSPVDQGDSNGTVYSPPPPKLQAAASFRTESPGGWIVTLSWEVSANEDLSFSVERWEEGNPTRYNLVLTNARSYTDQVEPNKTYYYRVFSVNTKANLSTPSNEVKISTVP
ncbi:MAG: PBP1A family penicillin-binding protein [Bacillota bacterium]